MDVTTRFNVKDLGPRDAPALLFAHGFGCDQSMWRTVAPEFAADHRVVLFDYVGFGDSEVAAYDRSRYDRLESYAADVVDLCRELGLERVVFVGHSVSSMIGVLAHLAEPTLFEALILVAPSARYLDDTDYSGGFSGADISDLLELMETNHLGWQAPLAGLVMANGDRPELATELEQTFCRVRPDIALDLARLTFLGDNRADLSAVTVPTLVLQTRQDAIAPMSAGAFVHEHLPGAEMVVLEGSGHCPQLSAPHETVAAIRGFLPR